MESTESSIARNSYGYMVPTMKGTGPIDPVLGGISATDEKKQGPVAISSSFIKSLGLVGIMMIGIYIAMMYIAGYHASVEYASDVVHMRWIRILMAVFLAPLYIGYVLLKSFVYDFLNSPANSITYSFLDFLLQSFTQSANETAKKVGNVVGRTMTKTA
jgi:uncharacterized membrane protein (DUF485 family)